MEFRLPTTVVPSRYDLRLEPDLDAATFRGEEVIAITVVEPVTEIALNAAELVIDSAAAESITSSAAFRAISVTGSTTVIAMTSSPRKVAASRSGSSRRSYRLGTTVVGSRNSISRRRFGAVVGYPIEAVA